MRPLGDRDRVPRPLWLVFGSDDFIEWLMSCHDDNRAFMRVYAHFLHAVDKIELAGPHADPKWVEKLRGGSGLWKVNYNDDTGAYRMFFKFGRRNGQRVAVFADGDRKTRDDFTPERYEKAERRVDACLSGEGVTEAKDG